MTALPVRTLGRTGLEVTALGYGALELRGAVGGRPCSASDAARILNTVLDSGINFIDTAVDYGDSEENIGQHIAHRRNEFFLASKCGCVVGATPRFEGTPPPHTYDGANITSGIDESLRRMRTDYLDLVQLHMNPSRSVLEHEDSIDALHRAQSDGKVRFIGISSVLPDLYDHLDMGAFDVFQIPYSGLQLEHHDAISAVASAGAGVVIRGGIAKGQPGRGNGQRKDFGLLEEAGLDDLLGDMTKTEFMLRFTISHPDMTTTIVGTLDPSHLETNVAAAAKGPLPSALYDEALRRLSRLQISAT